MLLSTTVAFAREHAETSLREVRFCNFDEPTVAVFEAAAQSGCYIAHAPVLAHGRIELLWYCREQSISDSYHRYGNLGETGATGRREVL